MTPNLRSTLRFAGPGVVLIAGSLLVGPAVPSVATAPRPAAVSAQLPKRPVPVGQISGLHTPKQVVEVVAAARHDTHAALWRFTRTGGQYRQVGRRLSARIGYRGLSIPTHRHAGDLTTPMGLYRFVYMFGSRRNPGVHGYRWRALTDGDCWSGSQRRYNRWVRRSPCWSSDEDLWASHARAYRYAAVINFNYAHPQYGRGAGIFLHVRLHRPTHGCVSIRQRPLVRLLRWARPGLRVAIGTAPYLRRHSGG